MTNLKASATALRDECERLAREFEHDISNPALTSDQQLEAQEAARVHWQMAMLHANDIAIAELVKPTTFTGRNKITKEEEAARIDFLVRVYTDSGEDNRAKLANKCFEADEASRLFPSYDSIYRKLTPKMFDLIRKRSKRTVGIR